MVDRKTGWITDDHSLQDYQLDNQEVRALLTRVKITNQFIRLLEKAKHEISQDVQAEAAREQALSEENLVPRLFRALKSWFTQDSESKELLNTSISHLKNNVEQILTNVAADIELFDAELVSAQEGYRQPETEVCRDRIAPPIDTQIGQHLETILNDRLEELLNSQSLNSQFFAYVEAVLQSLTPVSSRVRAEYQQLIEEAFSALAALMAAEGVSPRDLSYQLSDVLLEAHKDVPVEEVRARVFNTFLGAIENISISDLKEKLARLRTTPRPPGGMVKIHPAAMFPSAGEEESAAGEPVPKLKLPLTRNLVERITEEGSGKDIFLELPRVVDLSYWCSPVKNQGSLHACTSSAIASLVEYFQNRYAQAASADDTFTPSHLSARFLYKVSRRLGPVELGEDAVQRYGKYLKEEIPPEQHRDILQQLKTEMDTATPSLETLQRHLKEDCQEKVHSFITDFSDIGASLRQTFKALQLFGIPQERYWPYTLRSPDFDLEPNPFCYAFAKSYQALKYFRLDPPAPSGAPVAPEPRQAETTLAQIKVILASGFPAVFGFIYDETYDRLGGKEATDGGQIVCPQTPEEVKALRDSGQGHAVLAVGYDDDRRAFLIQNSWGRDWGQQGYGWLAYDYVRQGLATNWWTLLTSQWVEVGSFGLDNRLSKPVKKKKNK